ncbi:substrate-binding domain-containing protein [Bradyrhizobium sp. Arg237L]|uniref:substrate-binding domain-containing protein n=1 Tax=Bradyrhizobium sp. Arg237L TaxID=3003352 RepID=UPI00249DAB86|nr:substrate-binding domain-containing protein [Bradyrhizobium sp. Arg237L]MDI4235727.1 substrate-binding domain-containing protein [Bradyrhizobium sp. Arg237L]
MKMQSSKYLLGTASVLALLASSATVPANAGASSATKPIYFAGSTLASEAFRQILDCYTGGTVGFGFGATANDGYQFGGFPAPGHLPTTCTVSTVVNGLYAGVGSGNGTRGFIANNPQQWYSGSVTAGSVMTSTITTMFLPAAKPPIIDFSNTGSPATIFGSYPYPRVDVGMSDSPLAIATGATTLTTVSFTFTPAQSWSTTGGVAPAITVGTSTAVAYNPTTYGAPIQVPAFEVNVAIVVNTNGMTTVSGTTTISSVYSAVTGAGTTPGTQANQGAAIQLTTAQMCAIFSGLVTDWNDTTPNKVPYLDSAGTPQLGAFNDANKDPSGVAQPYSATSKTIRVVYRGDGSGTSFILTNYLKAVCPQISSTYATIFGATNLPSTSFATLIANINNSAVTSQWIAQTGSGNVASNVSTDATNSGRIGYVSADFSQPYTTNVPTAAGGTVTAPYSAALQNEQLRIAGIYVPDNTTPTTLEFIAPTPAGALNAWTDTRLRVPATTWTWVDFNIYNNVFGSVTQGGVSVTGKSVLPLTNRANAYPLSGTAFMFLYSCYKLPTGEQPTDPVNRVTSLTNYLTWHYAASNPLLTGVIQNVGFNPVPAAYATIIRNKYLSPSSAERIAIGGTAGTNCASASGAL